MHIFDINVLQSQDDTLCVQVLGKAKTMHKRYLTFCQLLYNPIASKQLQKQGQYSSLTEVPGPPT